MKMDMLRNYNKNWNYIGSSDRQKHFTRYLYRKQTAINYTSYIHDNLYHLMNREQGIINKITMKICFDLVFLVMGTLRSIKTLQIMGVAYSIILFVILIVSTPYYFLYLRNSNN